MNIAFQFDARKSVQAIAYLLSKLPGKQTDKVKLMKLLYLADRDHFLAEGWPITGGDEYAMPLGPVPSASLDLLNGQLEDNDADVFKYIQTQNSAVSLSCLPTFELADTERRVLDAVIARYGAMGTWALRDLTHNLPEYVRTYREGTSTRIPFELLLEIYSPARLYRHNRPVITEAMAAHMPCPFARPEPDL